MTYAEMYTCIFFADAFLYNGLSGSNYSFNLTNKLCLTVREWYSTIPGRSSTPPLQRETLRDGCVDDVTKNDVLAKRARVLEI